MRMSLKIFVTASLIILFALGSSTYFISQSNRSTLTNYLEQSVIAAMDQSVNWEWFVGRSTASDHYVIERTFKHTDEALAEAVSNIFQNQVDTINLARIGPHTRELPTSSCRNCFSSIHTVRTPDGHDLEVRFSAKGASLQVYPAMSSIFLALFLAGSIAWAQAYWSSRFSSQRTKQTRISGTTSSEPAVKVTSGMETDASNHPSTSPNYSSALLENSWAVTGQRINDERERVEFLEFTKRNPIDFDTNEFERFAFHSEGAWDQTIIQLYELALSTGPNYDRFNDLVPLVSLMVSHGHCESVHQAIKAIEQNPIVSLGCKGKRKEISFFTDTQDDPDAREQPDGNIMGVTVSLSAASFTVLAIVLALRSMGLEGLRGLTKPDTVERYTKAFHTMREVFGNRRKDSENWTEKGFSEVMNDLASCKNQFKKKLQSQGVSARQVDSLWNLLEISRCDDGISCGMDSTRINAGGYLARLKTNNDMKQHDYCTAFLATQVLSD